MPWIALIIGYYLCGFLIVFSAYGIYSIRENVTRTREEESVEKFRRELDEWDVALFEIPEEAE